jgi:putative two-component system response regulator
MNDSPVWGAWGQPPGIPGIRYESNDPLTGADRLTPKTPCILVVDDEEASRRVLGRALTSFGYEVVLAVDGDDALAKLSSEIDLVVLDASMPTVDGFTVAGRIRTMPGYFDLPIIMVTGLDGKANRLRALKVGVNDFISKPFDLAELQLRSAWLLKLKDAHDTIKQHRAELEKTVRNRTAALQEALVEVEAAQQRTHEAHLDTIRRLVLAAEHKDRATAAHIERIGLFCEMLAEHVGLPSEQVALIRHGSQMHDVGKLGIPDQILLKPGSLDGPEWRIMKQHAHMGGRILRGSPSDILRVGEVIALTHHERWDGKGYPQGLVADEIPLEGRICAVADVFDALTTTRPYRQALPNDVVYDMMQADRSRHFDPTVLDAFFDCKSKVESIQHEHGVTGKGAGGTPDRMQN